MAGSRRFGEPGFGGGQIIGRRRPTAAVSRRPSPPTAEAEGVGDWGLVAAAPAAPPLPSAVSLLPRRRGLKDGKLGLFWRRRWGASESPESDPEVRGENISSPF